MYLQTGDECLWLEQKRHSLETEATGPPGGFAVRIAGAAGGMVGTIRQRLVSAEFAAIHGGCFDKMGGFRAQEPRGQTRRLRAF